MGQALLNKDPYNLIITGVGGQGNVMASRIIANMLVRKGLAVTIGETFGASQRGGSVMSHLRISRESNWSPQIPKGKADMIVSLEPIEAIRLLAVYGHSKVNVLSNTRPIHPLGVIAGMVTYPPLEEIISSVKALVDNAWFIPATDEAMKMGNPIYGNVIMLGALAGTGAVPMEREDFLEVMKESFSADKMELNARAYDLGKSMVAR
ncbi:MAG: indolepyruvate oxidoreductase subunit beta [Proteobacteria bacterium]|nr:indolepyruvate oxidoreductase subunit beta [Pseudomonadota bacterium]MBU4469802.1 indolepyruvate oxidoreductase subunit beta [Pseudomonadota bacterium]MCG2753037.1 indolepyruvate oxidoreductase subunit beta [Desulfobacteraceae bacterium]